MADKINTKMVLVLMAEGPGREALTSALRGADYKPHVVAEADSLTTMLAELKPSCLIHDWATLENAQSIALQQRLAKMSDFATMCRVAYVNAVTPQLVALASDTGIRRVISYQTSASNVASEIGMALSSMSLTSELQRRIYNVQMSGRNDDPEVDKTIAEAYKQYPHDVVVKLEYGNSAFRGGDIPTARSVADQILKDQPHNVRAMNLLGRVLMKSGDDKGIEILQQANGLSPFNTDRLVILGDAFLFKGDFKKAGQYFGEAMDLEPDNVEAKKGVVQVKLNEGDVNAALDLLGNSISEEEAASFFNNAAVYAAQHQEAAKSEKLYRSALDVLKSPHLKAIVHFNLALSFERRDKLDEAMENLTKSIGFNREFAKAKKARERVIGLMKKRDRVKSRKSA